MVILGQGVTFAWYFKVLHEFNERHEKFEVIERLRMKEQLVMDGEEEDG